MVWDPSRSLPVFAGEPEDGRDWPEGAEQLPGLGAGSAGCVPPGVQMGEGLCASPLPCPYSTRSLPAPSPALPLGSDPPELMVFQGGDPIGPLGRGGGKGYGPAPGVQETPPGEWGRRGEQSPTLSPCRGADPTEQTLREIHPDACWAAKGRASGSWSGSASSWGLRSQD